MKALGQLLQKVPGFKGIQVEDVRQLADLIKESPEIGTIELKGWFGTGVTITRTGVAGLSHSTPMPFHMGSALAGLPGPAVTGVAAAEGSKPVSALKDIKSPMVGTYYSAPEPGAEPYVKVGARVAPGRTVCIIEAMKIMNEIEAEFTGVIREVCIEDSQPVEFGQVIFRVDPNG